jgi:hypothetical protein
VSNDDLVQVRCASQECRTPYTTSLLNFTTQKNACCVCGGFKAQRLDTKTSTDEPPPYQESAE